MISTLEHALSHNAFQQGFSFLPVTQFLNAVFYEGLNAVFYEGLNMSTSYRTITEIKLADLLGISSLQIVGVGNHALGIARDGSPDVLWAHLEDTHVVGYTCYGTNNIEAIFDAICEGRTICILSEYDEEFFRRVDRENDEEFFHRLDCEDDEEYFHGPD